MVKMNCRTLTTQITQLRFGAVTLDFEKHSLIFKIYSRNILESHSLGHALGGQGRRGPCSTLLTQGRGLV